MSMAKENGQEAAAVLQLALPFRLIAGRASGATDCPFGRNRT